MPKKPNCYKVVYIKQTGTKTGTKTKARTKTKYHSALATYGYFKYKLQYGLYRETSPSFGSLFVFRDLEAAIKYVGRDNELTIFSAYGENLRKAPEINFNSLDCDLYEIFWDFPESYKTDYVDCVDNNYWLADSITLYKAALKVPK